MIKFNVKIKSGLGKLKNEVTTQLNSGKPGHLKSFLMKTEVRYIGAMRKRFADNSKGGGDWPKLANSTIFARMRKYNDGNPAILRDTGILMNVLTPLQAVPGKFFEFIAFGFRTGFGGSAVHALHKALRNKRSRKQVRSRTVANTTIAEIAAFHQEGGKNLPQRKILVGPDGVLMSAIQGDLDTAIKRVIKDYEVLR